MGPPRTAPCLHFRFVFDGKQSSHARRLELNTTNSKKPQSANFNLDCSQIRLSKRRLLLKHFVTLLTDFPCTFEVTNCGWKNYLGSHLKSLSLTRTWKWYDIYGLRGGIADHTYAYHGGTGKQRTVTDSKYCRFLIWSIIVFIFFSNGSTSDFSSPGDSRNPSDKTQGETFSLNNCCIKVKQK